VTSDHEPPVKARAAIGKSLRLMPSRDRRLLTVSIGLQMVTSLLDLAGIALLGLVGALSVAVIQSSPVPPFIETIAAWLGLGDLTGQELVIVFGAAATILLLTKSVVSSFLVRRVLRFLANRQALLSARLTSALLARPITDLQARSSQETSYAILTGTGAVTVGLLGNFVIFCTEATLLVLLSVALLFVDPLATIGSVTFFALVALILQRLLGSWAGSMARRIALVDIASLNAVQEALAVYREIVVTERRPLYVQQIQGLRWQAARASADHAFVAQIPKYVFEAAMVLGGFLLAGSLFLTGDAMRAVGILTLFIAAASRVMPSLLRLQGATLGMRASAGAAEPTFALAESLGVDYARQHHDDSPSVVASEVTQRLFDRVQAEHDNWRPTIHLSSVTYTYPTGTRPAVTDLTMQVPAGSSLALVGRSGSGKSTLVDLILGVLTPQSGEIRLGGDVPAQALADYPGAVAYVPQQVVLSNSSVKANVALGLPTDLVSDQDVWRALEMAHLADAIEALPDQLEARVGESGVRLSGGQRQRLGIARALLTKPRLLVLDEATSALDAETEEAIRSMLAELQGDITMVIVAHRLSTVRGADQVAYLSEGRLKAIGTFAEVRLAVPALEKQAQLMGLSD
jgi:ABC-type multidrug transport system fused ATPase/permease subunit